MTPHESIVKDLEARQGEIQEAIKNAARSGGDSMKLRQELKGVQQKLQDARNGVATMQAAGRQAVASVTAKVGNAIAGEAIERILSGAEPYAHTLAVAVPAPDMSGSRSLIDTGHNLAAARQRVTDAEADHASAKGDADDLAGKLTSKRERHAEILRKRNTDEAGESSHAELYALSEDIKTLDGMHAEARARADNLLPAVNAARIALSDVEKQASKIEHRLAAEHLAAHARALDAAYISCLRACQAEGVKAGVTIGVLVQASHQLRAYASTGILQAPFRRA